MRFIITICLFFISWIAVAQADSVSLKSAIADLDNALLNKDDKALQQLLNSDVSYGHSNGWVENKQDIINDLKSGKLVYSKIENSNVSIVAINNTRATIRTNTDAEGTVNGNAFQLKLHVLQVWAKTTTGWQLIARQSTKL